MMQKEKDELDLLNNSHSAQDEFSNEIQRKNLNIGRETVIEAENQNNDKKSSS